jgi:uncharacterized Fe-S cluster-containing MiaB family protein
MASQPAANPANPANPVKKSEEKKQRTEYAAISEKTDFSDEMNARRMIVDKFPLSDRLMMKLCMCCIKNQSFSRHMLSEKPLFQFNEEYKRPEQQKAGLKIKIKGTGSLQLDPNVLHPFVRVHIIDLETWKPLAKSDPKRQGVAHFESVQLLNHDS